MGNSLKPQVKSRYGLSLRQESCLAVLSSSAACSRCAEACPAKVLTMSEEGINVAAGCLGCGRCAAACPTGALSARGYQMPDGVPGDSILECWKVPPHLLSNGACTVPCLGGLTPASLLERVLAAGKDRAVMLVDRGWCKSCSAGGSDLPPVTAQLEFVRNALTRLGWPSLPGVRRDPLPVSLMPGDIPVPAEREAKGRRAFFRSLVDKISEIPIEREGLQTTRRSFSRFKEKHFPERVRLIAVLENLSVLCGISLPKGLFPEVSISDACANHGICAGVCPTGALFHYEEATEAGILFDSLMCVGCGVCVRSCPESAIGLFQAEDHGKTQDGPVRLTGFTRRECLSCRSRFSSRNKEICPRCEKSRRLAADLFGATTSN